MGSLADRFRAHIDEMRRIHDEERRTIEALLRETDEIIARAKSITDELEE